MRCQSAAAAQIFRFVSFFSRSAVSHVVPSSKSRSRWSALFYVAFVTCVVFSGSFIGVWFVMIIQFDWLLMFISFRRVAGAASVSYSLFTFFPSKPSHKAKQSRPPSAEVGWARASTCQPTRNKQRRWSMLAFSCLFFFFSIQNAMVIT